MEVVLPESLNLTPIYVRVMLEYSYVNITTVKNNLAILYFTVFFTDTYYMYLP